MEFLKRFGVVIFAFFSFIDAFAIIYGGLGFFTNIDGIRYWVHTYKGETGSAVVVSKSSYDEVLDDCEIKYEGSIVIPDKILISDQTVAVTAIDEKAFCKCTGLTSIGIPKSIKSIGDYAFSGCSGLTSIKVESGNEKYDSRNNCNAIIETSSNTLIAGCKNTIIPDGVTSIGNAAFSGCSELTSVTIPNSVKSVGSGAFSGCSGLTDVFLMGESAPQITNTSFRKDDVKNATLHAKDIIIESLKGIEPWKWFKEFVCDEKVTEFNLTYYVDGSKYKTVQYKYGDEIVPESYPVKEGYTFSGWTWRYIINFAGEDIAVGEEIPIYMPGKDISVYGTFSWSKLTKDGVTYQVYDVDNQLAKVVGKTNVGEDINIASPIDIDGYNYSVTTISDNVFKGCASAKSITIPATITKIGERSFANIDKLTDVTILATDLPETDRTAFENSYIEDYVTLHVPEASLEKYKTTAPWKNFKEVVGIAGPKKCVTPTITFAEGKVKFSCETEGVTFKYEIKNADNFEGEGDEIEVGGVYNVSVYATKDDYIDSDKATMQIKLSTVKGDINGDGKVDVSDHVELSNIIMGINEEEAEVEQEETE